MSDRFSVDDLSEATVNGVPARTGEQGALITSNSIEAVARARLKVRAGPNGVHLFERATGLNVLLDEVRLPRGLWAVAPRQVSVALTNACDLACPYCYAPKSPAALDIERVASWLVELDAHGCLAVGFGGGEPTLYRRFAELCRYAAQRTRLAVTFTTHAHRLDEGLIAALSGSVHFVRVSVDGVGATYEALRGRPFGELRRRLDNVRTLAPFGINFVVNARTLADLDAATELAAEVGAVELLLLPEQPSRGGGGIDNLSMLALGRWVSLYRGTIPLTISEAGSEGIPSCTPTPDETGVRAHVHIDAAGVLKRTSYDHDGVIIGAEGVMRALDLLRSRSEEAPQ